MRAAKMLNAIAPGESNYNRYDRQIADSARAWLLDAARRDDDKSWVLYVGFVAPHFPLVVPQRRSRRARRAQPPSRARRMNMNKPSTRPCGHGPPTCGNHRRGRP